MSPLHYGFSNICGAFGSPNDEKFSGPGGSVASVLPLSPESENEHKVDLSSLMLAVLLWAMTSQVTMTIDAPLSGMGATLMGRAVNSKRELRLA